MVFDCNGQRIEVRQVYSWFDVYVGFTMVLHHIGKADADELIDAIKKGGGKICKKHVTK